MIINGLRVSNRFGAHSTTARFQLFGSCCALHAYALFLGLRRSVLHMFWGTYYATVLRVVLLQVELETRWAAPLVSTIPNWWLWAAIVNPMMLLGSGNGIWLATKIFSNRYRPSWPIPDMALGRDLPLPPAVGDRAGRNSMPRGIPCRGGYHAVEDTTSWGIPCREGYRAMCG